MRIYFNDSLCKRCPYYGPEPCDYKKEFYNNAPPKKGKYKLTHKCQYYRDIFYKGQLVVTDLYHHVKDVEGEWKYVKAYADVPGIIVGNRGNKFKIELLDPVVLIIRTGRRPRTEKEQLTLVCSKAAKDIRPLPFGKELLGNIKRLHTRDKVKPMVFN